MGKLEKNGSLLKAFVFWGEVREEARQIRVEAGGESFVDYVLKAV